MTLAVRKPRKPTRGWNGFLISIEIDPTCEILIAWIAITRKTQRLNREAESSDGSDRGGLPCQSGLDAGPYRRATSPLLVAAAVAAQRGEVA
jgi:hypothetical protein